MARTGGVIDNLGNNAWPLLITDSLVSDGVRGSSRTEECSEGDRLSKIAGASTSGGLRGMPGFSERRRDSSEIPRSSLDDGFFSR